MFKMIARCSKYDFWIPGKILHRSSKTIYENIFWKKYIKILTKSIKKYFWGNSLEFIWSAFLPNVKGADFHGFSWIFSRYTVISWRGCAFSVLVVTFRIYISIRSRKKNPDQKLLFFHGEIWFWKFGFDFFLSFFWKKYCFWKKVAIWTKNRNFFGFEYCIQNQKNCDFFSKPKKYFFLKNSKKSRTQIFKIKFLHEKIIIFGQDFFFVSVWIYRFEMWPLEH